MKLHLLRSKELPETRFEEIVSLMHQYPGPGEFVDAETIIEWKQSEYSSGLHREEIWEQCNLYRINNKINDEDSVVVLSDIPEQQNYFTVGLVNGERNFFVHTAYWENFIESTSIYPIASELASILLAVGNFNDMSEIEKMAHIEPRGCVFDYCINKKQISLRLRTADICSDCREYLKRKNADPGVLRQVFSIMEGVRAQMLFRERLDLLNEASSIYLDGSKKSIFFNEIGNISIKLSPKHLTVYHFFLLHEEGVAYRNLINHREELQRLYRNYSDVDLLTGISNEIEKLVNTKNNNLSTIVSDIRRKFESLIDKRIVDHYLISGPDGKRKKIKLERSLVSYSSDNWKVP